MSDVDDMILAEWERRRKTTDAVTACILGRYKVIKVPEGVRHNARVPRGELHRYVAGQLLENEFDMRFCQRVKEALDRLGVTEVTVRGQRCYKGLYRI